MLHPLSLFVPLYNIYHYYFDWMFSALVLPVIIRFRTETSKRSNLRLELRFLSSPPFHHSSRRCWGGLSVQLIWAYGHSSLRFLRFYSCEGQAVKWRLPNSCKREEQCVNGFLLIKSLHHIGSVMVEIRRLLETRMNPRSVLYLAVVIYEVW